MGHIYNSIKKQLKSSDYDPDLDTLTIRFTPKGVAEIGEPSFFDRIWRQQQENRARTIHPLYTVDRAIIYKDDGSETKYWDVGMPVKGTGAQIIAAVDLRERNARVNGAFHDIT